MVINEEEIFKITTTNDLKLRCSDKLKLEFITFLINILIFNLIFQFIFLLIFSNYNS